MAYSIKALGYDNLVPSSDLLPSMEPYYIPGSKIVSVTEDFGICMAQKVSVNTSDLHYCVLILKKDVTLQLTASGDLLVSYIALQGDFNYEVNGMEVRHVKKNSFNLLYTGSPNIECSFKGGFTYILLTVRLSLESVINILLQFPSLEYFSAGLRQRADTLLSENEFFFNGAIMDMVYKLVHTPHLPQMLKFHSDTIDDLILLQLRQAAEQHPVKFTFSTNELEQLYAVKKHIDNHLSTHYTNIQLARRAGMNEKKLVGGFTEVFGQPPYTYLLNERLRVAGILISESKKSIKEIASLSCYASQAAFSKAFKKMFGISPKEYRDPAKHK